MTACSIVYMEWLGIQVGFHIQINGIHLYIFMWDNLVVMDALKGPQNFKIPDIIENYVLGRMYLHKKITLLLNCEYWALLQKYVCKY